MKYKKGDLVLLDDFRIGKILHIDNGFDDYWVKVYNKDTKEYFEEILTDEDIIERIDL